MRAAPAPALSLLGIRWCRHRALVGQRVNGVVRLMDIPVERGGRAYLVERGLEEEGANANAALWALIEDYLEQARQFDGIPMEVSILG